MLFPEELKKIADDWGCDLYILPSSVHEVIVLPDLKEEVETLREMVCDVNENQVDKVERLSNSVYHYIRESDLIQLA